MPKRHLILWFRLYNVDIFYGYQIVHIVLRRLPSRAPRLFLPGYGHFYFLCPMRAYSPLLPAYAVSILLASSRIFKAAFLSRSITFPHSHRYIRSDSFSSFFTFPRHRIIAVCDPSGQLVDIVIPLVFYRLVSSISSENTAIPCMA